jgi:hypothetical protein
MKLIKFKIESEKEFKVILILNFEEKKNLTKYVVKREKRLDEWL